MRLFLTSQAAHEKKSPPKKAGANWSLETQQNNPVPLFLSFEFEFTFSLMSSSAYQLNSFFFELTALSFELMSQAAHPSADANR
jgi:hypothetical protein